MKSVVEMMQVFNKTDEKEKVIRNKDAKGILAEITEDVYMELDKAIQEAESVQISLAYQLKNQDAEDNKFLILKIKESLSSIEKQLVELRRIQEKTKKKNKQKYLYVAYRKSIKAKETSQLLREYSYKVREERIIRILNEKNST